MYLRAPYGVSSISEHYYRRMDTAFQGMSKFAMLGDDVVVYDKSRKDNTHRVHEFCSGAWSVVSPSIRTSLYSHSLRLHLPAMSSLLADTL